MGRLLSARKTLASMGQNQLREKEGGMSSLDALGQWLDLMGQDSRAFVKGKNCEGESSFVEFKFEVKGRGVCGC